MVYYKESGDKDGPIMLFLHGGGVSGWMWEKQVEYFTHYHCIVPDLLEHGLSNHGPLFSIQRCADDLIEIIKIKEKAADKPIIVIGFSLGAQVAIQMLSMKPDLIKYAVINSALVRPSHYKWLSPLITLSFPLIKNRSFSKLQAKSLYINESQFEQYYQESCSMKRETLSRVLKENMSFQIPEKFRDARSKILVTVGEKEKSVMKKSMQDIVECNQHCTGLVIPQVGHGISLAKPDYFNQLIEKWVLEEKVLR